MWIPHIDDCTHIPSQEGEENGSRKVGGRKDSCSIMLSELFVLQERGWPSFLSSGRESSAGITGVSCYSVNRGYGPRCILIRLGTMGQVL